MNADTNDVHLSGGRALLSLRAMKLFCIFMLSWQGSMVHGSILEVTDPFLYGPSAAEFYMILLAGLLIIERTITRDYTVQRSYFTAPTMLILLGLFISWSRGVVLTQRFAVVYEAHEAFLTPIALVLFLNCFREEKDRLGLVMALLLAPAFKSLEGIYIYFFSDDPKKSWGIIQMWRDGYLLSIGILSTNLFLHFAPAEFKKLRRWTLWTGALVAFTLVMSMRRTFILATLVSSALLIVTLGKNMRRRQIGIVIGLLLALTAIVLIVDPVGILARLSGIIEPAGEGSAYIRLLEYPNVLRNIQDNPIWGTAIGTQWKQYFRMPSSAVYTTLGAHNTYLYFPLRTGIIGSIGFLWLLARMWKSLLINYRLSKTEGDRFLSQLSIHLLIIYQVGCLFGLMYGDAVSTFIAVIMVMWHLQNVRVTGLRSYVNVSLLETWRSGQLVTRPRILLRPFMKSATRQAIA